MKNSLNFILTYLFICMSILLLTKCVSDEDFSNMSPKVKVVREIPLSEDVFIKRCVMVQNEEELESICPAEILQSNDKFQDIDFSRYTLLIGYGNFYSSKESFVNQLVERMEGDIYQYTINLRLPEELGSVNTYQYGVVIAKIPDDAQITFMIREFYD